MSGGEAAVSMVKAADHELGAVRIGYPVAVLPIHLNATLLTGYRVTTGTAFNRCMAPFHGFVLRVGFSGLVWRQFARSACLVTTL